MAQSQRDIKLKLYKSLFLGATMMIVVFWVWNRVADHPVDDLRLIINGKIVKGHITNAEEFSFEYETNKGVKTGYQHLCKYYFTTLNGNKIIDSAVFGGQVPEYLKNSNRKAYEVEIEYLPNNPRIHKIRDFDIMDFREWFIKKFLIGGALLVIFLSLGFVLIKKSIKQYRNEMQDSKWH